ncbi:MAG: hypothetical protein QOF91_174 [Alphaproteobacteria bacterium]|jgi:hypothetical protein|nr:hypothetical protein [Alphaproteobacteria bacterium]MEA3024889.1 hypothetical protein [Alphaproteobacteria bacterium]
MTRFADTVRDFWLTITGQQPAREPAAPEVIVHDPDAERPHDLDDPFFDSQVQSRIAGVIASNAKKND